MRVCISSGHGLKVRGASGYIDEVNEARRVVESVATALRSKGHDALTFHDDVSTSQSQNLDRIVDWHNAQTRDLDVSVHFNAYETCDKPMGCEVLYVSGSGQEVADDTVDAICAASGLINRGPKKRTDLAFLNGTECVAVLVETCFVDSKADVDIYGDKYQAICNAIARGLVGEAEPEKPDNGGEPIPEPLPPGDEQAIIAIASKSAIAGYSWKDRGVAPAGYIKGFALTWAQVVLRHESGDPAVKDMAKAMGDEDLDALAWYDKEFSQLGLSNDYAGLDTLRHLFVLLLGLGMRESSGKHCCGRDMSADNVTSDTAEAGLYQTSYNAHTCSPEFDKIMMAYEDGDLEGYPEVFKEGVSCSSGDWQSYGSGQGKVFQDLCKNEPAFAVESAALTLRNRRQHYGPINRHEAELRKEADWMLTNVQRYVLSAGDV